MTPRTLVAAGAVALAMLVSSQPARANERFDFKVPSSFVANGASFAAGQYYLVVNDAQDVVTLEPREPKVGAVVLPVETRVSEHQGLVDPELILDKVNGKLYVSELLVPGEDGYRMLATKGEHTHQSLKGAHVKK